VVGGGRGQAGHRGTGGVGEVAGAGLTTERSMQAGRADMAGRATVGCVSSSTLCVAAARERGATSATCDQVLIQMFVKVTDVSVSERDVHMYSAAKVWGRGG